MSSSQVAEYLRAHPKATAVLRAAVGEEESRSGEEHYLGWEWHQVRAYPASLMKLVVDGLIKVNYKSNSATCYLLVDREATKLAVAGAGSS